MSNLPKCKMCDAEVLGYGNKVCWVHRFHKHAICNKCGTPNNLYELSPIKYGTMIIRDHSIWGDRSCKYGCMNCYKQEDFCTKKEKKLLSDGVKFDIDNQSENNVNSKDGNIGYSPKKEPSQIFGTLFLLVVFGLIIFGVVSCTRSEITYQKERKEDIQKMKEYVDEAGKPFYEECMKSGGDQKTCTEYAIDRSLDNLSPYELKTIEKGY